MHVYTIQTLLKLVVISNAWLINMIFTDLQIVAKKSEYE